MESTTAVQEPNPKHESASAREIQGFVERRRRRRAKISAQLHVRAVNANETIEEVCMTVDVSRDGLLFMANRKGYKAGQALQVTFPFSTDAGAINKAQPADVVRVIEMAGGKLAVAVQFHSAAVTSKDGAASGAFSVSGASALELGM